MTVYKINARCTSCQACAPLCPTGSIFYGRGQYVIDTDTCHGCGVCARICPEDAIHPLSEHSESQDPADEDPSASP